MFKDNTERITEWLLLSTGGRNSFLIRECGFVKITRSSKEGFWWPQYLVGLSTVW
jgi:hypothetical protein